MIQAEAMIEGSLDILWENYAEPRATPKYTLLFARYDKDFKNGAQQPKRLVGDDELASYLVRINFTPEDAKDWIKQVKETTSASITNVFMPVQFLGDYVQQ